jgi:hypothetical protein
MSNIYRALCADLLDWAERTSAHYVVHPDVILRARTALAPPEPVAPTDEEIMELMPQQFRDDLATVSRLAAHGTSPDVTPGIFRVSLNTGALDYARAVLTRYARPTIQPVPVSERLPGAEDCDEEGRCWIFMPDIGTDPSWRLANPRDIGPYHTHWLPHHALPTPTP